MDKKSTKIVFMGTPDFSAKILEAILNDGYDVIGVITEADKPVGRKLEITPTPVKGFALSKGLKVFQPLTKSDLQLTTYNLQPDLVVVAAYGKILPKEVLEQPKYKCINFHTSLLPKLRGSSPIQSAILQGLEKTGVTIMIMDEGMDTGPILSQVEITIDKKETTTTLKEKMLEKGSSLLLKTLEEYIGGTLPSVPQNGDDATYCKMITKEDGHIDFASSAEIEERKIRAFNEWPGAFCFWDSKRIKVLEAEVVNNVSFDDDAKSQILNHKSQTNPKSQTQNLDLGEVFLDEKGGLCVEFAKGYWVINRLQLEGKNEITAKEFLNGHASIVGALLK